MEKINDAFCNFVSKRCGFEGVFSYINDKSAVLCTNKTETADFVRLRIQSFINWVLKKFDNCDIIKKWNTTKIEKGGADNG